jgi:glycine betaine catabolism B
MHVTFDHREVLAPNIVTFWFQPEDRIEYVPGQFTEMHLPHESADNRGQRRWFTLSSSPTEPLLGITTKFSPANGSSFKQQLFALQPRARLQLATPMGDFVLPKDPTLPLIFVAGGLGITPVRSMIKWLQDRQQTRTIHIIYAVSNANELAFLPLFKAQGLRLTTVLRHPPANYRGEVGRIHAERILQLIDRTRQPLIYLSGPESLTEELFKGLKAKGISGQQLITDYFPGYPAT